MHSAAEATAPALEILRESFTGPLMAYPDSGYFKMPSWQFVDIMPTDEFVRLCRSWRSAGVQILGGCCGLGIEHIEALKTL
jgi:homocysteine S-methyltransferase